MLLNNKYEKFVYVTKVAVSCVEVGHCEVAMQMLRNYIDKHVDKDDKYMKTCCGALMMYLQHTMYHIINRYHYTDEDATNKNYYYPDINHYLGKLIPMHIKNH